MNKFSLISYKRLSEQVKKFVRYESQKTSCKGDSEMIGVLSPEIIAGEAWYNRSYNRHYTRPEKRAK